MISERRKRNVYIAIMQAEAAGKGLSLSWEELAELSLDDAISTRAANALTKEEFKTVCDGDGWGKVNPYRSRPYEGWNGCSRTIDGIWAEHGAPEPCSEPTPSP